MALIQTRMSRVLAVHQHVSALTDIPSTTARKHEDGDSLNMCVSLRAVAQVDHDGSAVAANCVTEEQI